MDHRYCVIMAGGIGSRFWPMSTSEFPKQFHDVLGTGKTLLQQTFHRLTSVCPPENILIVTNEAYRNLVGEQLPEVNDDQIIGEPARRNTAPCIAYAAYKIRKKDPEAVMVVAPSDHLIINEEEFARTMEIAVAQAERGALITLGIKPSRPDTGYGYIQFRDTADAVAENVKSVKTFTEKPDLALAKKFLSSGDFYWNSGMFIWRADRIIEAFNTHLHELAQLFEEGAGTFNTPAEPEYISRVYPMCPNISIDFGIMEKAENVMVVLSDFGWSDLGTWGSLYTHLTRDDEGNAVLGNRVALYDSSNCIVRLPNGKTAVLQGLKDFIVVEENNTLLVCRKSEEQRIKGFVKDLQNGDSEKGKKNPA